MKQSSFIVLSSEHKNYYKSFEFNYVKKMSSYYILKTFVLTKKELLFLNLWQKKKKIDTSKKNFINLFDLSYKIDVIVFYYYVWI